MAAGRASIDLPYYRLGEEAHSRRGGYLINFLDAFGGTIGPDSFRSTWSFARTPPTCFVFPRPRHFRSTRNLVCAAGMYLLTSDESGIVEGAGIAAFSIAQLCDARDFASVVLLRGTNRDLRDLAHIRRTLIGVPSHHRVRVLCSCSSDG